MSVEHKDGLRAVRHILSVVILSLCLLAASAGPLMVPQAVHAKPFEIGYFGGVRSIANNTIRLETSNGTVELRVLLNSELKTERGEPLTLQELPLNRRVAVLAVISQPGDLVVRKLMVIPEVPQYLHFAGAIVGVSGTAVTIQNHRGSATVHLARNASTDLVGQTQVIIARREPIATRGPEAGITILKAQAQLSIEQVMKRLHSYILRAGQELMLRAREEGAAIQVASNSSVAEVKAQADDAFESTEIAKKNLEGLRARLEVANKAHVALLRSIMARVPEPTRSAIAKTLESLERTQAAVQGALAQIENDLPERVKSRVPVQGTLETVNGQDKTITLRLDGQSSLLTLRITDETIINARGRYLTTGDLQVGTSIVAQFLPRTREVLALYLQERRPGDGTPGVAGFSPARGTASSTQRPST